MPLALRVIDKVADLSDWDQSSFTNGMFVMWDATSGQYIGSFIEYTNATPTTATVGGVPAGTVFNATTLTAIFNELFYPYLVPEFTSFDIQGQTSPIEVGATISGSQTFVWTISNPTNLTPNSITITDVTASTILGSSLANTGSFVTTISAQRVTEGAYTWGISATNTESGSLTDDYSVDWYFRVYYGESANTTLDAAQIIGLNFSQLSNTFAGTYSFGAGNYKYIAFPDSFGSPVLFLASPISGCQYRVCNFDGNSCKRS
jgi:hypothetical protein